MKTFTIRALFSILAIISFGFNAHAQFGGDGDADITAYSFSEQTGDASIMASVMGQNGTVDIEVAYGTDLSSLVATFELSTDATAEVGGVAQTSAVTPNSFVDGTALVYTVTASDGTTTQDWDVTVTVADASSAKDIVDFNLPNQVGDESISAINHTVDITVASGTDVSNLVADFVLSDYATANIGGADQTSGTTANDFTNSVIYNIVAQDGSNQDWTVTVSISTSANTEAKITAYSFPEQTSNATITDPVYSGANGTIDIEVAYGTDISNLVASFDLSYGATAAIAGVDQVSGTSANDFSSSVTYTVTAEDASTTVDWDVNVSIAQNTENDILSYSFDEQTGAATIDATNHTVNIEVASGTDVSNLIASFSLSGDASADVSGANQESAITANDFTNTVEYNVTAQNGDAQIWEITVSIATEINTVAKTGVLNIYPNPATTKIQINTSLLNNNIQIIDITGEVVKNIIDFKSNNYIDISDLKDGIYFVKIGNQVKRLIKNN